jgi:hypothetical protein
MRITLTALNCKLITKKATPYTRKDSNGVTREGMSYRLGILYRDDLFTLKCSEDTFNSVVLGSDCDVEIMCQDGQYAGVDNAVAVIPKKAPESSEVIPKNSTGDNKLSK